jgi:hypothetical protein
MDLDDEQWIVESSSVMKWEWGVRENRNARDQLRQWMQTAGAVPHTLSYDMQIMPPAKETSLDRPALTNAERAAGGDVWRAIVAIHGMDREPWFQTGGICPSTLCYLW